MPYEIENYYDECYTTYATRRNHYSTIFQFFDKNHINSLTCVFFFIVFPRKGTLTDAGERGGQRPQIPQIPQTQQQTMISTNIFV